MTDTATANEQAFYAAPTRKQRFWRWCGFRFHLGTDVADEDYQGWTGWMQTRSQLHFGFVSVRITRRRSRTRKPRHS